MNEIYVYVADVGSIRKGRFGWSSAKCGGKISNKPGGTDISEFSKSIAECLSKGGKVALGFECPLFVPINNNPMIIRLKNQSKKSGFFYFFSVTKIMFLVLTI